MSFRSIGGAGGGGGQMRSNSTRCAKSNAKEDGPPFKLVMVGDSGVGKSCLLEKFLDLSSNNAFISTIGVDVRTHVIKIDGQSIKMQVIKYFISHCSTILLGMHGQLNYFRYRFSTQPHKMMWDVLFLPIVNGNNF
jgi:hypothetical protein